MLVLVPEGVSKMTYQELLEKLQSLSSDELAGRVDILDTCTNKFYPVLGLYSTQSCMDKHTYYTLLTFDSNYE